MIISDSNAVQFWVLQNPIDINLGGPEPFRLNWGDPELAITFNLEPKSRTIQKKCFYQCFKSDNTVPEVDIQTLEFQVDDPAHTYSVVQVYDTGFVLSHFVGSILYDNQLKVVVDNTGNEINLQNRYIGFLFCDDTDQKILAVSDLCFFQQDPDPSVVLTYQNDIEYDNISANSEMKIRIPASFFRSRFPEETETEDLSNGSISELTGSTKEQRLLDIQHVPDWFIRKLKHILKMRTKSIDGDLWKYEEAMEVVDGSPFVELRRCKTYLTLNESIVRNVYSAEAP
jgi:hypothetical protein